MAYHVIRDFGGNPGDDYVSSNPHWIIAVWRQKEPATYLRLSMSSFSFSAKDAAQVRGGPLIITDDCQHLQISHNKSSYVGSLSASLIHSGLNYLSEIFPGDYIMAWMFNNEEDYKNILEKIPNGSENVNGFDSGLKFVGKIQSLRKHTAQSPEGIRQVRYQLNATSFGEFDASIFYDPHLADGTDKMGKLWAQMGVDITKLIRDTSGLGIGVNAAISSFTDIFFSKGVPINDNLQVKGQANEAATGLSPEAPYVIPSVIAEKLGIKHTQEKSFTTFGDILEKLIGLQTYATRQTEEKIEGDSIEKNNQAKAKQFVPVSSGQMLGLFMVTSPQFTNKPLWSVLGQYLNPSVNEMYTTLRVNSDGRIMPTLVVRQIPFTSSMFEDRKSIENSKYAGDVDFTRFDNLPRWNIDPVLIRSSDIGRSDALRYNFVHVYGEPGDAPHGDLTNQITENPPVKDTLDIMRSGLRPMMSTIACHAALEREKGSPSKWMALLSDIVMGGQLTLTGVVSSFGIQSPICVGDNLELEGAIFHIEAITHSCSIDQMGRKDFSTNLNLSHGMHDTAQDEALTYKNDLGIYASVNLSDFTSYDPTVTADIQSEDTERDGVRGSEVGESLTSAIDRKKEEDLRAKIKDASSIAGGSDKIII